MYPLRLGSSKTALSLLCQSEPQTISLNGFSYWIDQIIRKEEEEKKKTLNKKMEDSVWPGQINWKK